MVKYNGEADMNNVGKREYSAEMTSFQESDVAKLYKELNIDYSKTLDVETVAKEYQEQMNDVAIECYETTAYLSR